MPITIDSPLAEQPIGPGVLLKAHTSLPSLPSNWYWRADVLTPDFLQTLGVAQRFEAPLNVSLYVDLVIPQTGGPVPVWQPQVASLDVENHVALSVSLRDVNHVVMEETVRTVTWEPNPAGVAYVQSFAAAIPPAPDPAIEVIKQAVTLDVGGVLRGISSMIGGVPPNFFTRELITPDRTGSGTLTRPRGNLTTAANGFAWEVVARAPGLGIDEGAPDAFNQLSLQLRYVLTLADGFKFTANHQATPELQGAWVWGLVTPSSLEYWIIPGVTMRFYWLVPTFTPFFEGDSSAGVAPWNPFGMTIGG